MIVLDLLEGVSLKGVDFRDIGEGLSREPRSMLIAVALREVISSVKVPVWGDV